MSQRLVVGQPLWGYCGGYFGRDHYGPCRVEAVGHDWVVVRNEDGTMGFDSGDDVHERLLPYTTEEERKEWEDR